jgi:hypothetical protein
MEFTGDIHMRLRKRANSVEMRQDKPEPSARLCGQMHNTKAAVIPGVFQGLSPQVRTAQEVFPS